MKIRLSVLALAVAAALAGMTPASADRIKNPTAMFNGLDKITGRIIAFEVAVDETVQFGSLQLTPRVCFTRPPTEPPKTSTFIEVDEVSSQNEHRRIFSGWMFAASPGLHGIEHPIYDVWLVDCKGGTERDLIVEPKEEPTPPPVVAEDGTSRRERPIQDAARPIDPPSGRVGILPPQGTPVQPRAQRPSQSFFPTNPVMRDTMSDSNR
jgi:hypothetical protein